MGYSTGFSQNPYIQSPGRPWMGWGYCCGDIWRHRKLAAGHWALGTVAFQHWGQDNYNLLSIQPIILYNFETLPGTYLGYNNSISVNWNARSSDKLTLPIGLTVGRTILLGNGDGLDLSIGAYDLVVRPENGPEWQFKFAISYFFN